MEYLYLSLTALLPIGITIILFLLNQKWKPFKELPFWPKQIIIGVIYGGICIFCTECGVKIDGAVLNVRSASPIIAGVVFGWPAAIISGVIGGVERYISAFWSGTYYTQLGCAIATVIAGLGTALIKKYLFKNNKVSWFYALGLGLFFETIDILLIFLTNLNDIETAFLLVKKIGNVLILAVGLTVGLTIIVIQLINHGLYGSRGTINLEKKRKKHIKIIIQIGLFISLIFSYIIMATLTFNIQTNLAENQAYEQLSSEMVDVSSEIKETSDNNILTVNRTVKDEIEDVGEGNLNNDLLRNYMESERLSEINYVNSDGIIIYSTNDAYVGLSFYAEGATQMNAFTVLLIDPNVNEFVQPYQLNSSGEYMKYSGVKLNNGGFVQVGFNTEKFHQDINSIVSLVANHRHIGQRGYLMIIDETGIVISSLSTYIGKTITQIGINDISSLKSSVKYVGAINGVESHYLIDVIEGYLVIGVISDEEIAFTRDLTIYLTSYLEFMVICIAFFTIYALIDIYALNNLSKVNDKLDMISNGNLNEQVPEMNNKEFDNLANSINKTVDTLKEYIDKEAKRLDEELAIAKDIQMSFIPRRTAYLSHHEFKISALMNTAKEVGGDFYDYFLLPNDKLGILIADVSGKGVPAAMFMMRAKSLIKSLCENGISCNEVFNRANRNLCERNDTKMFITAWLGVISLDTGHIEYVNAGHNPPLIRQNGHYSYLTGKHGLVLGAIDIAKYPKEELTFNDGDGIYLYTDGVTEANNKFGQLYSEGRLIKLLNDNVTLNPEKLCNIVMKDIDKFVDGYEQSDDITMLAFTYLGKYEERHLHYKSKLSEYTSFKNDFTDMYSKYNLSHKMLNNIEICAEEIFVNIAQYSYKDDNGDIDVLLTYSPHEVSLTFIDSGKPFDPLKREDPDTHLPASEREIGGLGIFMVKNISDFIHYSYQDKKNILVISLYIEDANKGE